MGNDETAKGGMRRGRGMVSLRFFLRVWLPPALAFCVAAGAMAYVFMSLRSTVWCYFTDGASIRENALEAEPRMVLWEEPHRARGEVSVLSDIQNLAFSPNGGTVILSRNAAGTNAERFVSEWNGSEWLKPASLASNNTQSAGPNFPFQSDGDVTYFASNRPGAGGGFDIYCSRVVNGKTLLPENLGNAIDGIADDTRPAVRMNGFDILFSSRRDSTESGQSRLFASTAREVTCRLDLSRLDSLIGNLLEARWWILAFVLALGLLIYLSKHYRDLTNLYHKCLMASAIVHMAIAMLVSFWKISERMVEPEEGRQKTKIEFTVNVDNLTREKLALNMAENITKMPASVVTVVAKQADEFLPQSDFVSQEENVRAVVARSTVKPVQLENAPSKPDAPVTKGEAVPLASPPQMTRLPELEMPGADAAMEVKQAAAGKETKPAEAFHPVVNTPAVSPERPDRSPVQPSARPSPVGETAASDVLRGIVAGSVMNPAQLENAPSKPAGAQVEGEAGRLAPPSTVAKLAELEMPGPEIALEVKQAAAGKETKPAEEFQPGVRGPAISVERSTHPWVRDGTNLSPEGVTAGVDMAFAEKSIRAALGRNAGNSGVPGNVPSKAAGGPGKGEGGKLGLSGGMDKLSELEMPAFDVALEVKQPPAGKETRPAEEFQRVMNVPTTSVERTGRPWVRAGTNLSPVGMSAGGDMASVERSILAAVAAGSAVNPAQLENSPSKPGEEAIKGEAGRVGRPFIAGKLAELEMPGSEVAMEMRHASAGRESGPATEFQRVMNVPTISLERAGRPWVGGVTSLSPVGISAGADAVYASTGGAAKVASLVVPAGDGQVLARNTGGIEVRSSRGDGDLAPAPSGLKGPGATVSGRLASVGNDRVIKIDVPGVFDVPEGFNPAITPYILRKGKQADQLIEGLGGSGATEEAVGRALDWFQKTQEPDGRWAIEKYGGERGHDIGASGFALLCYMGWGSKHTEAGKYQATVAKCVAWLVKQVKKDGNAMGAGTMYDQGIATLALSEAYGLTKDTNLVESVTNAVGFIVRAQNRNTGGWRYQPGEGGDTSVLGWQLMALKSAQMAGIEVPQATLDLAGKWLTSVGGGEQGGLYGYQGKDHSPAMAAEAMFCRQLLGSGSTNPAMRETASYLNTSLPKKDQVDFYYWYYGSLALHQHQGPIWEEWNRMMKEILIALQLKDGQNSGSWEPVGKYGDRCGRVVASAMATLTLEVYYRYLPLTFADDKKSEKKNK